MRTHNNRAAPINNCTNICTYCAPPSPTLSLSLSHSLPWLYIARVLAAGNCQRQQQLAIAKKLQATQQLQLTAAAAAAARDTTVPGPQHQITMNPPRPPCHLSNFVCSLLPVMASTSATFLVAALSYGYGYGSRALGYGCGSCTDSVSVSASVSVLCCCCCSSDCNVKSVAGLLCCLAVISYAVKSICTCTIL